MKTMTQTKHAIVFYLICLTTFCQSLFAQTGETNKDDWLQQMRNEELKITAYIDGAMKNVAFNDSLKQAFVSSSEFHEVADIDLSVFKEQNLRNYYRSKYLNDHPEVIAIYNPGRVALTDKGSQNPNAGAPPMSILCDYGNFETATTGNLVSQGYNGYVNAYTGGVCGSVPLTNVAYSNVGFGTWDNFLVTNNAPDPYISALGQTHNGSSHAIRINAPGPCPPSASVNMLQKSFSPSATGKSRILFSYAMVVENPPYDHLNANTFFLARVLDNTGTEVGSRICLPSSPYNPIFNTTSLIGCNLREAKIMWKDWTCEEILFDAVAGKTYTIEFFVADCSGAMHFAYAYVDDICAETCCPPAPKNVKCQAVPEGNHIFWDPEPNAIGYMITIHSNDPMCCKDSDIQFMSSWTVTGTDTLIPYTFTKCFSYTVNSICKDSTVSETLEKFCSCAPECPPPLNVKCLPIAGGSQLVWDPVAGAEGYQLILHSNDPLCCNNGTPQFMAVWTVTGTDTIVPSTFSGCFSWTINTLCGAGLVSQSLEKYCSCTPPCQAPRDLLCNQVSYGSVLSWSAVPNADHYELVIYNSDPFCCSGGTLPFMAVYNTITTNYVIPTSFSSCFSWYVNTVCEDGTKSQTLEKQCSCSPPRTDGRPAGNNQQEVLDNMVRNFDDHTRASAAPNPASEYIEFRLQSLDGPISNAKLALHLYDMTGREIIRKDVNYNENILLDVQAYPTGEYIYEFKDAGRRVAVGKVQIERH